VCARRIRIEGGYPWLGVDKESVSILHGLHLLQALDLGIDAKRLLSLLTVDTGAEGARLPSRFNHGYAETYYVHGVPPPNPHKWVRPSSGEAWYRDIRCGTCPVS
jgi:hypothetical protein